MKTKKWNGAENVAIVAAYLGMLDNHHKGTKYSKAKVRRDLIAGACSERSEGSVEFKMMNVSGCMRALGKLHLPGYQPAMNYQADLMAEVCKQTGFSVNPKSNDTAA